MRLMPLLLGLLTLGVAWPALAHHAVRHAFYAHMLVHMSVVAVAAPLIAAGLRGSSFDPVTRAPSLFSPLLASLVELGVVWAWHTPVLHAAAHLSTFALILEQASFLLSGLYLWMAVLGGRADDRSARAAAGIGALLLTLMHMTLLGALLGLSSRPLYAHIPGRHSAGLSALDDQQLGGAIMILVGGISYLAGGLWLARGLLGSAGLRSVSAQRLEPGDQSFEVRR